MDETKPNAQGYTMSDLKNHFIKKIIEAGHAKTKKQAENLFIEALLRDCVYNELMDTVHHIADPDSFNIIQEERLAY
jgi:hypothetical protein